MLKNTFNKGYEFVFGEQVVKELKFAQLSKFWSIFPVGNPHTPTGKITPCIIEDYILSAPISYQYCFLTRL